MTDRKTAKSLVGDKRYKDAPRYQVIYGYEDEFKDSFIPIVTEMIKDVTLTASKMIEDGRSSESNSSS